MTHNVVTSFFFFIPVAVITMAIIPPTEILSLFIEFPCIWTSKFKQVECCKSVFLYNIHFSTHFAAVWTVPPETAAPLTFP